MIWMWTVASTGEMRNKYRSLVRKHEAKRALGRLRCRWKIFKWISKKYSGRVWTGFI
jgi:hypothetical protein